MTTTQFIILTIAILFGAPLIAILAIFCLAWRRNRALAKKFNGYPHLLHIYLTQDQLDLLEDICLQTGAENVRVVIRDALCHYEYLVNIKKSGKRIYTTKGPGFHLTEMDSAQLNRIKKSENN